MGGWFVDIFVEFLFRTVTGLVRRHRSRTWPVASATVTDSTCPRAGYGCHVAEIHYTYDVDGEPYTGTYEKPFISHRSGEDYARHFIPGTHFKVLVNPGDPSVSVASDHQPS
jgi:hypothetical protein